MRVFRISKPEFVARALSGEGAAKNPGRWNSIGRPVAYTAGSAALAMLEMLVHVDRRMVPAGRRLLTFDLPEAVIESLDGLPTGWDRLPYSPGVRAVGDRWLASGVSLALRVPSAVVREEFNLLINPAHPHFGQVRLVDDLPLELDSRLFESGC